MFPVPIVLHKIAEVKVMLVLTIPLTKIVYQTPPRGNIFEWRIYYSKL